MSTGSSGTGENRVETRLLEVPCIVEVRDVTQREGRSDENKSSCVI